VENFFDRRVFCKTIFSALLFQAVPLLASEARRGAYRVRLVDASTASPSSKKFAAKVSFNSVADALRALSTRRETFEIYQENRVN
jgi:hypothetical protein